MICEEFCASEVKNDKGGDKNHKIKVVTNS